MKKILTAVGCLAVTIYSTWRYFKKRKALQKISGQPVGYPEEFIREQLVRNYSFLGEEGMARLRSAHVFVVGCGGVGSHAAAMLCRSGVGCLTLIDFDYVTLSSLNRHAVATLADVGKPKVEVLAAHLHQIAPFCRILPMAVKFDWQNAEACGLLEDGVSFVVDCIDNMESKVDLLRFAQTHCLPIISSMGAGARAEPTKVLIADISETLEDPLARRLRIKLKQHGISHGISAVFSVEKPSVGLIPFEVDAAASPDDYAVLPNFRIRTLPVLGPMPAIFGSTLAAYVINKLAVTQAAFVSGPAAKGRHPEYARKHRDLAMNDKALPLPEGMASHCIKVDSVDISYLLEEVWRAKSAYSGRKDKLGFIRWDIKKPATVDNLVLLSQDEMKMHALGKLHFDLPQQEAICAKLQAVQAFYKRWN